MTPLEIGGIAGAALVAGGSVMMFINKLRHNGSGDLKEIMKEQLKLLQEIRDNLLKTGYEISNRFAIQTDKLTTIANSITSIHERLNGRIDRQP